jgi:Holliday junction resolvasome RuvABC endonuclease subunit
MLGEARLSSGVRMTRLDDLARQVLQVEPEDLHVGGYAEGGRGQSLDPPVALHQRVLCFDQATNNCGWAIFIPGYDLALPEIVEFGTIHMRAEHRLETERYLRKAASLGQAVHDLIDVYNPEAIVHEMPMSTYRRPGVISAWIAATVIRVEAARAHVPAMMVSNVMMKGTLMKNEKASKREVRDFIAALFPEVDGNRKYNEHVADAMALGLAAMQLKVFEHGGTL